MASFTRRPVIKFDSLTEVGIDKLSFGSLVTYTDSFGSNQFIEVLDNSTMTATSTLTDFLGTPTNYKNIAKEVIGPTTFTQLSDTPAGFTANTILSVNATATAIEMIPIPAGNFLGLTDTPTTFTAGKFLQVNPTADGIIESDIPPSGLVTFEGGYIGSLENVANHGTVGLNAVDLSYRQLFFCCR